MKSVVHFRWLSAVRRLGRDARGSGVTVVVEGAAILGWFAIVVTGESFLADAIALRRAVEDRASAGVLRHAADGCTPNPPSSVDSLADSVVGIRARPPLRGGDLDTLVADLGLGDCPVLSLHGASLSVAEVTAVSATAEARPPLPRSSVRFEAQRMAACAEPAHDGPSSSVACQRTQIWRRNVEGF